jgi:peptidoglycan/xylan/chitin deacetylase (PgdA/CDA1 family)
MYHGIFKTTQWGKALMKSQSRHTHIENAPSPPVSAGKINEKVPNHLRVLTYHRVANPDATSPLDPGQISATISGFAQQMSYLAQSYHVVSMEEVLEAVEGGKRLPRRAVLITFDDAYFDWKSNAWPILRRFRFPATIFVPTAYPDQPQRSFWWDRFYYSVNFTLERELQYSPVGILQLNNPDERRKSFQTLRNYVKTLSHNEAMAAIDEICAQLTNGSLPQKSAMGWDELRKLAKEGVTLGAHTRTHPILTQIPLEQVRQEVRGSKEDLEREIGNVSPVFCYPNGNHNDEIVGILKEEGYKLAFTCLDGHSNLNSIDPLRLRRTDITRKTSPYLFRLRLLRLFTYVDMLRHRRKH